MTRQDYIKRFEKVNEQYRPEYRHKIDDDYAYSNFIEKDCKYKIDDIITLLTLYEETKDYIKTLKIGDKIKVYSYGNIDNAEVEKINYKRGLNRKGEKVISSINTRTILSNGAVYNGKIKTGDILYKDIQFYTLSEVARSFWGLSFYSYTVEKADEILKKIIEKDLTR